MQGQYLLANVLRDLQGGNQASIQERQPKSNKAALHQAATLENMTIPILQVLLNAGADVNAKDNNRETPLHAAAWNFNNLAINALLGVKGIKVNEKNNNHQTAYKIVAMKEGYAKNAGNAAWKKNCQDTMDALIGAGANLNL